MPITLNKSVCENLDDDKFFARALAGGSDVISGRKNLLKDSGYKEIEVLKPRDFLERYSK